MDDILFLYKKYNRPGAQKLFQLAKADGVQTTLKDIKEFLSSRSEEQQLKETKQTKQSNGHIVSYNPFNRLQLDIFVLKKYNKYYSRNLLIIRIQRYINKYNNLSILLKKNFIIFPFPFFFVFGYLYLKLNKN